MRRSEERALQKKASNGVINSKQNARLKKLEKNVATLEKAITILAKKINKGQAEVEVAPDLTDPLVPGEGQRIPADRNKGAKHQTEMDGINAQT